nr:DNA repair protein RecO [Marinicella sp. W31]MDC2876759.1 DNA repair protein RecO [Marinicella sp. W31]
MEWQDEGIVLGMRRHGETSAIAEVMTLAHGRHLGLVRGGRSRTMRPVLQPGNRVSLTWRARLSEHLGEFRVEPVSQRAGLLMQSAAALHGMRAMAALLRLLPERDPHRHLCDAVEVIIAHLDDPTSAGELFVRFELALLNELGFGLDLARCAANGSAVDLVYVSPKSGRAVSKTAGAPYADRMLALPDFLRTDLNETADPSGLEAGFRLTGFFLDRHVYEPRGITPDNARESFIIATLKALEKQQMA